MDGSRVRVRVVMVMMDIANIRVDRWATVRLVWMDDDDGEDDDEYARDGLYTHDGCATYIHYM